MKLAVAAPVAEEGASGAVTMAVAVAWGRGKEGMAPDAMFRRL